MNRAFFIWIAAFAIAFAQTEDAIFEPEPDTTAAPLQRQVKTISGELPPVVQFIGRPYHVIADIAVPPGKTVAIEPGVVFIFKNFTGLQVHGTLIAEAGPKAPIVFTSENDLQYGLGTGVPPAPYDWNGITLTENAFGSKFTCCTIQYTLYGIKSLTEYILVKKCTFRKNGRGNLNIAGVEKETGSAPFSYMPPGGDLVPPEIADNIGSKRAGRSVLLISSIIAMAGGAAIGTWQSNEYVKDQEELDRLSAVEENTKNENASRQWEDAKARRDRDLAISSSAFGLAFLGGVGLIISIIMR